MSLKSKSLHGLATVINGAINDFDTTIRKWVSDSFALKSHTHNTNTVLFAPDFSRRIKIYSSADDPKGTGFRCRNCSSESDRYPARIFQLKYPCFIYNQVTIFDEIDSDMILEICANKQNVIAQQEQGSGTGRYMAAVTRDSTWSCLFDCRNQTASFLVPLGSVGYWHHYATGAIGSSDSGDNKYRDYYIVPAYGTPIGTTLIELYSAEYGGKKQSYGGSDYWLNWLTSSSHIKTVKA